MSSNLFVGSSHDGWDISETLRVLHVSNFHRAVGQLGHRQINDKFQTPVLVELVNPSFSFDHSLQSGPMDLPFCNGAPISLEYVD